jgi:serine/threonine protein phosphatase 1
LRNHFENGDYLFVHAGIRPNIALADQDRFDLIWIREPFLSSKVDHGKYIVHGHSINSEPDIQPNRMGIDTGAYSNGCLTCAVFEGNQVKFLQT